MVAVAQHVYGNCALPAVKQQLCMKQIPTPPSELVTYIWSTRLPCDGLFQTVHIYLLCIQVNLCVDVPNEVHRLLLVLVPNQKEY